MKKPTIIGMIDLDDKATKQDVTIYSPATRKGGFYTFEVPFKITMKRAIELQRELGYDPLGYDFHTFKSTPTKTTWQCSSCCD